MNRPLIFDSPYLLGFEHTKTLIERAAKAAAEGYPPYNVEDRGDGDIRITLAVAGFSPDQLEVTVEDRQLTIAGRRNDAQGRSEDAFLHRGISRCAAPGWSTGCCISTSPGPNPSGGCCASRSVPGPDARPDDEAGPPDVRDP